MPTKLVLFRISLGKLSSTSLYAVQPGRDDHDSRRRVATRGIVP